MSYKQIRLEKETGLAWLVLNRPRLLNAMNAEMGEEIAKAVTYLNAEPELRVVLVRGEGQAFAAGGDFGFIEERVADTPEQNRRLMRQFYRQFLAIRHLAVPSIALVHGATFGAGLCFALACDIRIAATDAVLCANFVRIGLHPGMGATWLLPQLVGPAKAAELLFTGEAVDATEAGRIGLVNHVVDRTQLIDRGREMAAAIAKAAPLAVGRTKGSVQLGLHRTLDEALDAEACAQTLDYQTQDMAEGIRAFRSKRAPKFRGR